MLEGAPRFGWSKINTKPLFPWQALNLASWNEILSSRLMSEDGSGCIIFKTSPILQQSGQKKNSPNMMNDDSQIHLDENFSCISTRKDGKKKIINNWQRSDWQASASIRNTEFWESESATETWQKPCRGKVKKLKNYLSVSSALSLLYSSTTPLCRRDLIGRQTPPSTSPHRKPENPRVVEERQKKSTGLLPSCARCVSKPHPHPRSASPARSLSLPRSGLTGCRGAFPVALPRRGGEVMEVGKAAATAAGVGLGVLTLISVTSLSLSLATPPLGRSLLSLQIMHRWMCAHRNTHTHTQVWSKKS